MEIKSRMNELLSKQKEILKQYEVLSEELDINTTINENIALKKETEDYKHLVKELKEIKNKLQEENMSLKVSLKEQLMNEKIDFINGSKRKLEIYFEKESQKNINKLSAVEETTKNKLNQLMYISNKELCEEKEDITSQINAIKTNIEEKIKKQKEIFQEQKDNILDQVKREYDELKNEGISEEILQKKKKYNDIEVKIGLSWINKVGIILLLLGISTAMKYTYSTWFNDYMKGISGFLLGGLLLAVGEWFNRKEKNIFCLGLIGGGIGTLYLTIFSSYFMLNILDMTTSLLISILVTVVSIVLSQRYKSMTICGISLLGGYFPFFSYVFTEELQGTAIYIAMGYLLILNLMVLGVSLRNKWIHINYLSFILNMPCLLYLSFISSSYVISILYSILTFTMYCGITLIYPIRAKIHLKILDIILLGLNTFINCCLIYTLFENEGLYSYRGALALMFALVYFGLGQFLQKNASQENPTQALFYITAMTFSVLMIPFQFGVQWASLGWLIESLFIICYAVKYNVKKLETGGWIILGLCFGAFLILDFVEAWIAEFFFLRYTLMTLGLIGVLYVYINKFRSNETFKYTAKGRLINYYKYFIIFNTWVYIIRMIIRLYDQYIDFNYYTEDFFLLLTIALATGLFTYLISNIKYIQDNIVNGISIGLYILVDLIGLYLSFFRIESGDFTTLRIVSIGILILYNLFIFFNMKYLLLKLINYKGVSYETLPISLAIYILGSVVILLTNQFDLSNINLIISIFFIIMSFVYIIFGFKKNQVILRRFGLGLSIFSTAKLFLFDLAFLSILGKIIAYFCFGLVLLGISFIYNRLRVSLDNEGAEA